MATCALAIIDSINPAIGVHRHPERRRLIAAAGSTVDRRRQPWATRQRS
jgi:hypothetical protein